jgi:hypothetical protein
MKNRFVSPLIIILCVTIAVGIWGLSGDPRIPLVILCAIATLGPMHSVRLYRKNDRMMGGLSSANHSYTIGFCILASGNIMTCWGFLNARIEIVYLGSVLLLIGMGFLIGASSFLFSHIIRRGMRSK